MAAGETRWERNARLKNRKRDRKMPLLAWAGIADQVVPDVTPAEREAFARECREDLARRMEEGRKAMHAAAEWYIYQLRLHCPDVDLEELNELWEKSKRPKSPEYLADFWEKQLVAHAGGTPLDWHNKHKESSHGNKA